MRELIEVKGFIEKKQTHVTQPKFEERHIKFLQKFFDKPNLRVSRRELVTIIHDSYSLSEVQLFVNAFIYEFGKW